MTTKDKGVPMGRPFEKTKGDSVMDVKSGVQSVKVVPGRKIVVSAGVGKTSVDEIKKLTETVLERAKAWKQSGWAYVADCSQVAPVTPAEAGELVVMTQKIVEAGCKALGFVEGNSIMLKVQAKKNTERSATGVAEGHFATMDEVLEWLKTEVNM